MLPPKPPNPPVDAAGLEVVAAAAGAPNENEEPPVAGAEPKKVLRKW